ncbi:MAG: papain-like cysteine peptidase [Clostridium sp.]|nr:papain-like cysteine peptidase [Clostridium sp.]
MLFENFISLGGWCGVASSMSKLGVRNFSGPFDWYFNYDFEAVLHCIETEFEGFLDKRNLVLEENGQEFQDIKNHFLYVHEIKTTS